MSLSFEQLI